jgi:hypothetical protein
MEESEIINVIADERIPLNFVYFINPINSEVQIIMLTNNKYYWIRNHD